MPETRRGLCGYGRNKNKEREASDRRKGERISPNSPFNLHLQPRRGNGGSFGNTRPSGLWPCAGGRFSRVSKGTFDESGTTSCKFIFSGAHPISDLAVRRDGNPGGQVPRTPAGWHTVAFGSQPRCLKQPRWLKRDPGRTILLPIESSARGSNVPLIRSLALRWGILLSAECFWQRLNRTALSRGIRRRHDPHNGGRERREDEKRMQSLPLVFVSVMGD